MRKFLQAALLISVIAPFASAADQDEAGVKTVVQQFQEALEHHDVVAIQNLVSSDIVVLENGHRNDGWTDFRDNHLVPEFKEPVEPSKWELVKVVASAEMAWGYTKQTIDSTAKDGKHRGFLVWSAYVLQRSGRAWKIVLLDWSVRRIGAAD